MTRAQSVAWTPEVFRRVLHKQSDSPTRHVQNDVVRVPRVSIGDNSLSCFPRGFFPGLLSSVNSPLVPEITWMTSSQVRPSRSNAGFTADSIAFPRVNSCHKCWIPGAGRILPRPHRSERPIGLSSGEIDETREQDHRGESVDTASANPSPAHQRRTPALFDPD